MNKIAFFSVIFPAIEKYLDSFFISIKDQTVKDFDLYIINNGLKGFNRYKPRYKSLNIRNISLRGTPLKVRQLGIEHIKRQNYDVIIFGDADDYFAANRVEKIMELMKGHHIVINDFHIVNDNGDVTENGYLSKRLNNRECVDIEFVRDKNIFGLSNTAIKGSIINEVVFGKGLIAADWFLFSKLLIKGYKAIFTDETVTYYRQHRLNTVGISDMSGERVLKGVRTKLLHYQKMFQLDPEYTKLYKQFKQLNDMIISRDRYFKRYLEEIKSLKIKNPLWWEQIKIPENLEYESKTD